MPRKRFQFGNEPTPTQHKTNIRKIKAESLAIDAWMCPNCERPAPNACDKCGWKLTVAPPLSISQRATFNRRPTKKGKPNAT